MEQDTEVEPRSQVSLISPHQIGTGTHLNPEGGSLQAAPIRGRTNQNTGTTSNYCGQALGRIGDFICSVETTDGTGGMTIGHEGRTP